MTLCKAIGCGVRWGALSLARGREGVLNVRGSTVTTYRRQSLCMRRRSSKVFTCMRRSIFSENVRTVGAYLTERLECLMEKI